MYVYNRICLLGLWLSQLVPPYIKLHLDHSDGSSNILLLNTVADYASIQSGLYFNINPLCGVLLPYNPAQSSSGLFSDEKGGLIEQISWPPMDIYSIKTISWAYLSVENPDRVGHLHSREKPLLPRLRQGVGKSIQPLHDVHFMYNTIITRMHAACACIDSFLLPLDIPFLMNSQPLKTLCI